MADAVTSQLFDSDKDFIVQLTNVSMAQVVLSLKLM